MAFSYNFNYLAGEFSRVLFLDREFWFNFSASGKKIYQRFVTVAYEVWRWSPQGLHHICSAPEPLPCGEEKAKAD